MYVLDDEAAVVAFDLLVDGEFVSPDSDEVTYSVRNAAGTVVQNGTLSLGAEDTKAIVTVLGTNNAKATDYDYRYVRISFLYDSNSYTIEKSYRIIDWVPLAVSASDVRNFIGLGEDELPDHEIDLVDAYVKVSDENSEDFTLSTILAAGDRKSYYANAAIRYRAAIEIFNTLYLRIHQSEQTDNIVVKRFSKLDIPALRRTAEKLYGQAVTAVAEGTQTEVTTFLVATPVDAVTGA